MDQRYVDNENAIEETEFPRQGNEGQHPRIRLRQRSSLVGNKRREDANVRQLIFAGSAKRSGLRRSTLVSLKDSEPAGHGG